jgi:hypothetical protein
LTIRFLCGNTHIVVFEINKMDRDLAVANYVIEMVGYYNHHKDGKYIGLTEIDAMTEIVQNQGVFESFRDEVLQKCCKELGISKNEESNND